MLNLDRENLIWAWTDKYIGIVLDEFWGSTRDYAANKTERVWGKRRFAAGEMRLYRVILQPLTDEEQAAELKRYEEWRDGKDAEDAERRRKYAERRDGEGT